MSARKLLTGFLMAIGMTLALPTAGAFAQAAPQAPTAAAPEKSYVLGPEDEVEVDVLGRSDFRVRAKIASDGTIQLPYLGTVKASDMTARQFGQKVTEDLEKGGYFTKPIVSVDIVSFASRYVTVLGEVGKPGLIPVDRPYHLSELLARVDGVKDTAADYVVVRPDNGAEKRYSVKALATGDASQDPLIEPGEKIFSPKADVFYIAGQVHSPGTFPIESDMTLQMAIGRAAGLTDLGTSKGVKVTHSNGKVEKLKLQDKIQAGDVIVVGERLF